MFSFQRVPFTVPDSSWRVAEATCPGPNLVWTSLGFSISTIFPLTSTLLIPGFSSAIFIALFSFHYFPSSEVVPHAGDSDFDLFSRISARNEDDKVVDAGYSIAS